MVVFSALYGLIDAPDCSNEQNVEEEPLVICFFLPTFVSAAFLEAAVAEQVVHVFVADQPTCATFEVDAETEVEKKVLVEKMERYENDKWNH